MATNINNGLTVDNVPVLPGVGQIVGGQVFFVCNANPASISTKSVGVDNLGNGYGTSISRPFSTLAYALAQCYANNGDIVYVLPGHAETYTAATTAAPAGVSVIGVGNDINRPVFTLNGAAATFTVSNANCVFSNFIVQPGVANVVAAFTDTAGGTVFNNVDVVQNGANSFVSFATLSAAAARVTVQNCNHYQSTAATSNAAWFAITGGAASRGIKFFNNNIQVALPGGTSASNIIGIATSTTSGILVAGNVFCDIGAGIASVLINFGNAGNTGVVTGNSGYTPAASLASSIVPNGVHVYNNG